jgi:hypothetical protein
MFQPYTVAIRVSSGKEEAQDNNLHLRRKHACKRNTTVNAKFKILHFAAAKSG